MSKGVAVTIPIRLRCWNGDPKMELRVRLHGWNGIRTATPLVLSKLWNGTPKRRFRDCVSQREMFRNFEHVWNRILSLASNASDG